MTASLPAVLDRIESGLDATRGRWFDLLRIPSVSAQPLHAPDCDRAAEWLRAELATIGFEARVLPTAGHPVVLAHHAGTRPGPRLLYYGHYDVQPAEPLDLWTTPPFEPVLGDGPHGPRISARGAVDDKGQVMMWLEALRAWHDAAGGPPCPTTVLIEGEEETGSVNLEPFLAEHRDALAADIAIISDTNMWDIDTPAVTTRLRGMVYVELTLHAAERDLHSGLFGGSALNPINALTHILGDLHDSDGRIRLPGFYDGVADTPPGLMAEWEELGFDEAAFLGGIGLSEPVGENGRTPLERMWARPTADINGIWGGYTGPGSQDGHRRPGLRQDLVPPGTRPGASRHLRLVQALRGRPNPGRRTRDIRAVRLRAGRRDPDRQPLGGGCPRGVGRRIRPPCRSDGKWRFHPRGGEPAPHPRAGLAAGGVRPGRRPGSQPQREVRVALLPPRPAQSCPAACEAGAVIPAMNFRPARALLCTSKEASMRHLVRPAALAALFALAGCVGAPAPGTVSYAPGYPPPPGYALQPTQGYAPQATQVAAGTTCYAGFYSCPLPGPLPVGAQCSCPGLGAPSFGTVR